MHLTSRSHAITWLLFVTAGSSRQTEGFLLVSPLAVARTSKHARHDRRRCGVFAVACSADHVSSGCCPGKRWGTSSTNKRLQQLLLRQRRNRRILLQATEAAGEELRRETKTTGSNFPPPVFGLHTYTDADEQPQTTGFASSQHCAIVVSLGFTLEEAIALEEALSSYETNSLFSAGVRVVLGIVSESGDGIASTLREASGEGRGIAIHSRVAVSLTLSFVRYRLMMRLRCADLRISVSSDNRPPRLLEYKIRHFYDFCRALTARFYLCCVLP